MPAPRIDQLYCTSCTYGTSALHRRSGGAGDQIFEESARAGSVSRQRCHDVYRRIAAYLSFRAPGDMPTEVLARHTANSLPLRRLIYLPSTGGYRILGHISYRQTDAAGRPGSYFAHVLIQDHKEFPNPWSPLDCLRLWGAREWVIEDRADLPFDLPSIKSLDEFGAHSETPINDDVLFSFLTAPLGSEFRDRGVIIPVRWRKITPAVRRQLLVNLIQATLNLDVDRREQLLIAVEPSVAALLFYGILRFLPAVGFADKLSFSTYESHRERPVTVLAATCFHDPTTADLSEEWYSPHAKGAAFNTFKTDRHTPFKKTGQYAARIVAKFITEGSVAIDTFRDVCGQLGISRPEDLESLSGIDDLIADLLALQSNEQLAELNRRLPREPGTRAYLRKRLAQSLDLDLKSSHLSVLFSNPQQALLVFKLLATSEGGEIDVEVVPAVQTMVHRWPDAYASALLSDKDIPPVRKIALTRRYVEAHKCLPHDAALLFFTTGAACIHERVLEAVLRDLPGFALRNLVEQTFATIPTAVCLGELLRSLLPLTVLGPDHDRAFRDLFQHPWLRSHPQELAPFFDPVLSEKGLRDKVAKFTPAAAEPLSAHLRKVLDTLGRAPLQLDQNLAVLKELQHFIPDCHARLEAWQVVSAQLHELQRLNAQPQGVLQRLNRSADRTAKDQAAKQLTLAAQRAFSPPAVGLSGDPRADQLVQLARVVLGEPGLPDDFHAKVQSVFTVDLWPENRATRSSSGVAVAATIAAVCVGLAGLAAFTPQILKSFKSAPQVAMSEPSVPIKPPVAEPAAKPTAEPTAQSTVKPAANPAIKPAVKPTLEPTAGTAIKPGLKSDKMPPQGGAQPTQPPPVKPSPVAKVAPTPKASPAAAKPAKAVAAAPVAPGKPAPQPVAKTAAKGATLPPVGKPTVAALHVAWPTFFDLPTPVKRATAPKPLSDKPSLSVQTTVLQSWVSSKGAKRTPEEVQLILTGLSAELVGVHELNEYFVKSRDPLLRDQRLHVELVEIDAAKHSRSLQVFRLTPEEFEARELDGIKPPPLNLTGHLCSFNFDEYGLHFGWAKTADPIRYRLQQLIAYCWLEIKQDSLAEMAHIALTQIDVPYLIKPRAKGATETVTGTGKIIKVISSAPWDIEIPRTEVDSFDPFVWAITKVKVTDNRPDPELFDVVFPPPDEALTSHVRLPQHLVPDKFDAVELTQFQNVDATTKVSRCSVTVSAPFDSSLHLEDRKQAESLKDSLRAHLAQVLTNPDNPYQSGVTIDEADPDSMPELAKKKLKPTFKPFVWVNEMKSILKKCDEKMKFSSPPDPPRMDLQENSTLEIIQRKLRSANTFEFGGTDYMEEYTSWVDEALIHPACRKYQELLKLTASGVGISPAIESDARKYVEGIQKMEIEELSRLINGKWVPVPMRPKRRSLPLRREF